jgi:hypothetical protein
VAGHCGMFEEAVSRRRTCNIMSKRKRRNKITNNDLQSIAQKKRKFEQHENHINSNAPEVNFDFFRHLYL